MTIFGDIFDNLKDQSSKIARVLNFSQLQSFPQHNHLIGHSMILSTVHKDPLQSLH